MKGGPQPPCLDCRQRRVGCHDPKVCQAWAAYDARAKAVKKEIDRRRFFQEQFQDYHAKIHARMVRRKKNGH